MKRSPLFAKAAFLTIVLLLGLSLPSMSSTYTALTSGNWSDPETWGGNSPGFDITQIGSVVIPPGVTVTLDSDLTINNPMASVLVQGAITGGANINITGGSLSGPGAVSANDLMVGSAGSAALGVISVNQFTNSNANLVLSGTLNVNYTVVFNAGTVRIGVTTVLNLANNATVNMAGGTFAVSGGALNMAGSFNLLYTGAASAMGTETTLPGLQNITVNLSSPTGVLGLTGNLTVPGALTIQRGVLALNSYGLTLEGSVYTWPAGFISGCAGSDITINSTADAGAIAFFNNGQTIHNLTVNLATGASVLLSSDITVTGALALNGGNLDLNGYNLTLNGTSGASGNGCIVGNALSNITVNGAGLNDVLVFNPTGNTLGSLTVNTSDAGSVYLWSDMVVEGQLVLSGGSLNMNGKNLTIDGPVLATGSGTIGGNIYSNLTFNGYGGAGIIAFTRGSQAIHNLTINKGSSGGVSIASPVTVGGTLWLESGILGIGDFDLVIADSGLVQGGGATGYILTIGTGRLIMTVANAGGTAMYPVGTQFGYAPVSITNNSAAAGQFGVLAVQGVLANGGSGADISTTQSVVNTSWQLSSTINSGLNVNMEMLWSQNMQVNGFTDNQAYLSQYINGAWTNSPFTAAVPVDNGYYSLSLTGVSSLGSYAVFGKNTATGVKNVATDAPFTLYPNPASDVINILLTEAGQHALLKIFDAVGNEVISQQTENTLATVNVNNLAPGVYFASFNNQTAQAFIKK